MTDSMLWASMISAVLSPLSSAAGEVVDPAADPAAVVVQGNVRFTFLTPALVRMEWSPAARFEDRPTILVTNRRFPVPNIETSRRDGWLTLQTDALAIRYREDGGRFDPDNLSVALAVHGRQVVWRPGSNPTSNLLGTRISLDGVSGAAPLGPGLLSRDGWAIVDDSNGPVVAPGARPWPQARAENEAIDWYFFGHGHDYKGALRDFTRLAGRVPLPPRFVFGSWWSRYWPYSDQELKDLVAQFDAHDVPLDVLVIDMDWHQEGWSGYSWEPKYFPDPAGFLQWAHQQGLRVTLNLHPGFDIEKHETRFAEFARAAGYDPQTTERIPYDHTNPKFVEAYFKELIHPLETDGVDFWWLDYGGHTPPTRIDGLDELLWCNALHFVDLQRTEPRRSRPGERGLMFSRWGGLANHRYPIGFSGDTHSTWASLAFQPYFTATAGNVCFPYWSHDIGGHYFGPCEPELYARWIQWAVFSPALRTHTTRNPQAERRIWSFPGPVFKVAREAFHLRYDLIPYIYTAARQCYDTALPLCRPLYYEWPEADEAYRYQGEYLFGDQFLVVPVANSMDPLGRAALVRVWIPPGQWTGWFTGDTLDGPHEVTLSVPLNEIPVFVRAGAVIPTAPRMRRTTAQPADAVILHVFPGDSGRGEFYEDDGETTGYQNREFARTVVTHQKVGRTRVIDVHPAEGGFPGMPAERRYELRLRDTWPAIDVSVNGAALTQAPAGADEGWWHDAETLSTVIRLPRQPVATGVQVIVTPRPLEEPLLRHGLRGRLKLLTELAELLGGDTPTEIREVLRIREYVSTDVDRALRTAKTIVEDWGSLAAAAMKAKGTPDVVEAVTARLIGGSHTFRVEQTGEGELTGKAVVELAADPPYGGLRDLVGRVRLAVSEGWRLQGEGEPGRQAEFRQPLDDGKLHVLTAALIPEGSPRTGWVRAEFGIRHGEREIRTSSEEVLLPSIGAWWIVGPFHNPWADGLDHVFPLETRIDLAATYEGKGGMTIGWKKADRRDKPGLRLTDEFAINFHEFFGTEYGECVAYALTYLHSPAEREASLAIGSDDGVVAWLNGQRVHYNLVARPYAPKQDRVPIKLKAGVNTLLVKIQQGGGGWGFGAHVETPDGKSMPEVEARLTP